MATLSCEGARYSALTNELILSTIFKLCPTRLLANIRLVCKDWYVLSLSIWRSTVCLPLEQGEQPEKFLLLVEDPTNQYSRSPYKNFRLNGWESKLPDEAQHYLIAHKFWTLCGPNITTMELVNCHFSSDDFRNVVYTACPNLQRLTITELKFDRICYDAYSSYCAQLEQHDTVRPVYGEHANIKSLTIDTCSVELPVSYLELLAHFPGLTQVKLYNARVFCAMLMLRSMKVLRIRDKLDLKHLDIFNGRLFLQRLIPPEAGILFMELQLPLETLKIDVGCQTAYETVRNIIEAHATTLKVLHVTRYSARVPPYGSFPSRLGLELLQELWMDESLSANMEFLRLTPNLKRLHIGCREWVQEKHPIHGGVHIKIPMICNSGESLMNSVRLAQLSELQMHFQVSENDVRRLVNWLPNVERAKLILNDVQFATICESWRKLQLLHVCGPELTDVGVTGLSSVQEGEIEDDEVAGGRLPNITFLTELTNFAMGTGDDIPSKLSDTSAFHGFLKLHHLESIFICAQMSDKAKEALLAKVPHCFIHTWRKIIDHFGNPMSQHDTISNFYGNLLIK